MTAKCAMTLEPSKEFKEAFVKPNPSLDPFHPTPEQEYELLRRKGDERFGSECPHASVKGGYCTSCLRKVL